jgi:hypothetical protein
VRGRTTDSALAVVLLAFRTSVPPAALAHPSDGELAAERIDPEYAAGKAPSTPTTGALRSGWLSSAALRDICNNDHQNYLGDVYRNAGRLKLAFRHYQPALQFTDR